MKFIKAAADAAKKYARQALEDDPDCDVPLILAALNTQNWDECAFIGLALVARNESLAEAPFRYGDELYDETLKAICTAMEYEP